MVHLLQVGKQLRIDETDHRKSYFKAVNTRRPKKADACRSDCFK